MNARFLLVAVMSAPLLAAPPPVQPEGISVFAPFSRAQFVERLERFYGKMDAKGHGYFTADDLVLPGYHIADPPVIFYPGAQVPFHCVDANRDGKITEQEYVGYAARVYDAMAGKRPVLGGDLIELRRAIGSDAACSSGEGH